MATAVNTKAFLMQKQGDCFPPYQEVSPVFKLIFWTRAGSSPGATTYSVGCPFRGGTTLQERSGESSGYPLSSSHGKSFQCNCWS